MMTGLVAGGCYPRELIRWSPDGGKALVVGKDALYTCDADGDLSEAILENVTAVAWLPDGEHFVAAVRHADVAWDDIADRLPGECRSSIRTLGEELAPNLDQYRDDPERLQRKLRASCDRADVELLMFLYMRKHHADALEKAWPQGDSGSVEVGASELGLYSLADGKRARLLRRLDFSLAEHRAVEVAPGGEFVACVVNARGVVVAPLDGSDSTTVLLDGLLPTLAWSSDGRAVFIVQQIDDDGIGRLRRVVVRDEEGRLASPGRINGTVALLAVHANMRLQSLGADLLVGAAELELPAPASRKPRPRLYRILAGEHGVMDEQSGVEPIELPETVGEVVTFAASPDFRRVMVVGDSAAVLVDLESGKTTTVSQERLGLHDGLTVVPAWRGNEEVWLVREDQLLRVAADGDLSMVDVDWPAEIMPPRKSME